MSNENEHYGQNNHNQGYSGNQGQNNFGRGYKQPKRRETVNFQCLQIGNEVLTGTLDETGCEQVFDTLSTANLACSLFEQCVLIGQNIGGNYELFSEGDNIVADLSKYNLSIPTMDKTQTTLIYGKSD